jgi:hypothetical protein
MTTYLPTSYNNLKAIIQEIAEDTSQEFVDYIPTAIYLAEERLFRLVDHDFTKEDTSKTLTVNNKTITKPTDHRVTKNLYITVGGELVRLIRKSESFIRDYWPSTTATGVPKYYGNKNDTQWTVAPTADGSYNVTIDYEAQPTALSSSNQTNIFITKYPDLLLYASLSAAAEWMRDSEFKAEWENKLQEALGSTNIEGVRDRRDDNAHVYNPEGGLNTKG